MRNEFAIWLNKEIDKRGWNQSELARRSDVSRATISKLCKLTRDSSQTPEADTVKKIAKGFNLPPEYVFRKAGLLPEMQEMDPRLAEANQLISELPDEYKKQALQLIRFLHDTHVPPNTKKAESTSN